MTEKENGRETQLDEREVIITCEFLTFGASNEVREG